MDRVTTERARRLDSGEPADASRLDVRDVRTGREYHLPIDRGAIRATDLAAIGSADADHHGLMSYDPAFMNTASCISSITYIDGDRGILRYRGYPIEQLAGRFSFLDVAYLITRGELPDPGHRVYKTYDPRARIIKETAQRVFRVTGTNPLLDIALAVESIALRDRYFIDRQLYPNVDFYSGLIYEAMGLPIDTYTTLFAVARMAGWVAQWLEMIQDPEQKIARPRQIYIGPPERPVPA